MNISNVTSLSDLYSILQTSSSNQQSLSSELTQALTDSQDSVSISSEGMAYLKMPPPPEAMDFESMSDEELKSYLEEMQAVTGNILGMDASTSISDLTEDDLLSIREMLTEMSSQVMNQPTGIPPQWIAETAETSDEQTQYDETAQNSNASILKAISAYSNNFAYI